MKNQRWTLRKLGAGQDIYWSFYATEDPYRIEVFYQGDRWDNIYEDGLYPIAEARSLWEQKARLGYESIPHNKETTKV
ncbi:MAG: hypothetical protein QF732_11945 [Nitrospinaceae bacterium]|nr:hypothetical protein [Nitrospinaceae bacterium]|tara:strand:- start:36 stop:269 length:234 start_codon:yes stop_codon:yes gene_type:complete